jgi:outer membrane murein-binding lipoprotein Lpp
VAKQVQKTPEILSQMTKVLGDGVDVQNLPVWEAVAANSLPLRKKGSIFEKAVIQQSTMTALSDAMNAGGAPMQVMHDGGQLPVGKAFMAQMAGGDAAPELRVLFYVDPTKSDFIAQLDNSTIDEVSLGFMAAHLLCSECGWDYMGDDATSANLWDRVCANDHAIGQDGVHLNLSGLDRLYELSLVSTGAVQGSKIVPRSKQTNMSDMGRRLAASGVDLNAIIFDTKLKLSSDPRALAASSQEKQVMADVNMELITQLTDAKSAGAVKDVKITELSGQVTALTAQVTELTAKVAAFPKDAAEVQVKLDASVKQTEAALTFLRDQATKIANATGGDVSKIAEMSVEDLSKSIVEAQAKLASLIPVGGVTPTTTKTDADAKPSRAAFKTRD